MLKRILPFLAAGAISVAAFADVKLPALFTDHMVLQREAKLPFWGWADPGEQVTVATPNQTKGTTADDNGNWKIVLDPIDSKEPITITVKGKNTITINDVLMGEVWVCSGQSNMEWPISRSKDPEAESAAANWPKIRFFNVSPKKKPSREPAKDVEAAWAVCTPQTAGGFSAVGYFFGRHLHQKMDVPIGLINVSWGGMPAEAFTDRATLESDAEFKDILDTFADDVANYATRRAEYEKKLAEWQATTRAAKEGERTPPRPGGPRGPDAPNGPSNLWNGMIHPIIPYAMRGVIWYQGESNAGTMDRALEYRKLMPAMIAGWRKAWGQGDFPFLIVQLANFKAAASQPAEPNSEWAMLREAQTLTDEADPKTGMAVIIDIGEEKDIHPKNKQDVGKRLALWAEKIAYGNDVVYSGPTYKSMRVEGNMAIIDFENIGGGLIAKGDKLEGFAIRGEDGVWHAASATIDDHRVIVQHEDVPKPVAVRYAWANNPKATLFNKEGLPAGPFRTDKD